MDDELKKMLIQLMEGQEAIRIDVSSLKTDVNGLKTDVKRIGAAIDGEIKPMDRGFI